MFLLEKKRPATGFEALGVSVEHDLANLASAGSKMVLRGIQGRTNGQSDQIAGVGQPIGFVEIIDTPYQSSEGVAPGTEAGNMKISHGENWRGGRQLWADLRPKLAPAEEGAAQKAHWISHH